MIRSVQRRYAGLLVIAAFVLAITAGTASAGPETGPFEQGSVRATLIFGSGKDFGTTYSIFGIGASYFIENGIETGLSIEEWTGASPHILRVSPDIRYVFYEADVAKPYVGLFYRHAFVQDNTDENSLGGRAGFNVMLGRRTYAGFGLVFERFLRCTSDCSVTYPELLIAFTF